MGHDVPNEHICAVTKGIHRPRAGVEAGGVVCYYTVVSFGSIIFIIIILVVDVNITIAESGK